MIEDISELTVTIAEAMGIEDDRGHFGVNRDHRRSDVDRGHEL